MLKCQCPGKIRLFRLWLPGPCDRDVTQEDGLCDKCRVRNCPSITTVVEDRAADRRWDLYVAELLKQLVRGRAK